MQLIPYFIGTLSGTSRTLLLSLAPGYKFLDLVQDSEHERHNGGLVYTINYLAAQNVNAGIPNVTVTVHIFQNYQLMNPPDGKEFKVIGSVCQESISYIAVEEVDLPLAF